MTILRMDNVGLVVDDLEAAVAFFLDLVPCQATFARFTSSRRVLS